MKIQPITPNCQKVFLSKDHVCFGISPFNSYFSDRRIEELALWGRENFETMHFFVPDVPSSFTLEALGYAPDKAAWKARRQSQYLYNKIQKVLINMGYTLTQADEMFLGWEKLSVNQEYRATYQEVCEAFQENLEFRKACLGASRWVLEKRVPDPESLSSQALESAARYLLAEIPLFLNVSGILGKNNSVFSYHQSVGLIEDLYLGRFLLKVASNQGFVVVEPEPQVEEYEKIQEGKGEHLKGL